MMIVITIIPAPLLSPLSSPPMPANLPNKASRVLSVVGLAVNRGYYFLLSIWAFYSPEATLSYDNTWRFWEFPVQ